MRAQLLADVVRPAYPYALAVGRGVGPLCSVRGTVMVVRDTRYLQCPQSKNLGTFALRICASLSNSVLKTLAFIPAPRPGTAWMRPFAIASFITRRIGYAGDANGIYGCGARSIQSHAACQIG